MLGKLGKHAKKTTAVKLPGLRLHARVVIRDGRLAFLGSQSLRQLELDARREVGVVIDDPAAVRKLVAVFESDWQRANGTSGSAEAAGAGDLDSDDDAEDDEDEEAGEVR
jgi:phosphatidylserine/phosphatidylglycerophosphate/cardiolipin synthase-like enzyme